GEGGASQRLLRRLEVPSYRWTSQEVQKGRGDDQPDNALQPISGEEVAHEVAGAIDREQHEGEPPSPFTASEEPEGGGTGARREGPQEHAGDRADPAKECGALGVQVPQAIEERTGE